MSEKKQCQCYTAVQIGTCDEYCDRVSEKKQTAVMWLKERLPSLFIDDSGHYEELFQQALQMEREQIEEAHGDDYNDTTESVITGSQYYTDTYGE